MGIDDYTRKPWWLQDTDGQPRCTHQKRCVIKIDGPGKEPGDMTVRCLVNPDNDVYENGTYHEDAIFVPNSYKLSLVSKGSKYQLHCDDFGKGKDGGASGSWTADDSPSPDGDA